MTSAFGRSALLLLAMGASSCALFATTPRVRSGELVTTGDANYDAYFRDVHALQVARGAWRDERASAARPLVDAMGLLPDSGDVTIVSTARAKLHGADAETGGVKVSLDDDGSATAATPAKEGDASRALVTALDATIKSEVARRKKLRDVPPRIDVLLQTGRDLELRVGDDFKQRGDTASSVHEELEASFDVLASISRDARIEAHDVDDFLDALRASGAGGGTGVGGGPGGRDGGRSGADAEGETEEAGDAGGGERRGRDAAEAEEARDAAERRRGGRLQPVGSRAPARRKFMGARGRRGIVRGPRGSGTSRT